MINVRDELLLHSQHTTRTEKTRYVNVKSFSLAVIIQFFRVRVTVGHQSVCWWRVRSSGTILLMRPLSLPSISKKSRCWNETQHPRDLISCPFWRLYSALDPLFGDRFSGPSFSCFRFSSAWTLVSHITMFCENIQRLVSNIACAAISRATQSGLDYSWLWLDRLYWLRTYLFPLFSVNSLWQNVLLKTSVAHSINCVV